MIVAMIALKGGIDILRDAADAKRDHERSR